MRTDWVEVEKEAWRIVTDLEWSAAHAALRERQDRYKKWLKGEPGGRPSGRGQSGRYLCSGLAQCPTCGGSMVAVKWGDTKRAARYVCSTAWNKGTTCCPNSTPVPMEAADATVRELLLTHVLKASVVEVALDLAVAMMRDQSDPLAVRRAALEERLAQTQKALANLASTIETMGPVPSIVEALKARDADRQRFLDELVPLQAMAGRTSTWTDAALRRALHAKLDDWRGLVDGHVAQARTILDAVLADRITFVKEKDASGREVWAVSAPLAWDRILTRLAPDAFAGLQGLLASPAGFEPAFQP